jgi:hypothetical protein
MFKRKACFKAHLVGYGSTFVRGVRHSLCVRLFNSIDTRIRDTNVRLLFLESYQLPLLNLMDDERVVYITRSFSLPSL